MRKYSIAKIIFITLSVLLSYSVAAKSIQGVVVKVSDGDTITVLDANKKQHKIRFSDIDAPESRQPWGNKSKEHLINRIAQKMVTVKVGKKDRYGRVIGTVYLNKVNINREQVRLGNAWVYTSYLNDKSLLNDEIFAKRNNIGLWKLPENERIQPWIWRKIKK